MLYGRAPSGSGFTDSAGEDAVSESSSVSFSSGAGRLTAGASGAGFKRATVAGDGTAAGGSSPIAGAGGLIGATGTVGADATDCDGAAAGDISDTGAGFSDGLGSG